MLRNDFSTAPESLGNGSTSRTLPPSSSVSSTSAAVLVLGASNSRSCTTLSFPLVSASVSAERRAPRFIFLFTRISWSRGWGPCTTPPPVHCGERFEPCRARPVPFWRQGLRPPPETSPRVLVECVPRRIEAKPASTTWCIRGTLTLASNTSGARSRVPTFLPATETTSTFGISDRPSWREP